MRKLFFAFCLISVFLLTLLSVSAAGDKIWDFTTEAGIAEWAPNASIAYEVTANGTKFSATEIFWQIYQQCNRSRTHRQTGVFRYRL